MKPEANNTAPSGFQPHQLVIYTRARPFERVEVEVLRRRGQTRNVGFTMYEVKRLDTGQRLRVAIYSLHNPHTEPEVRS